MSRKSRGPIASRRSIDGRARVADSEYSPRSWRGMFGRPGWVDEIFEKEPRCAAFRDFMWRELGSAVLELESCDTEDEPETPREADLRARIERIVLEEMVTDAEQDSSLLRGGFKRFLQLLATRDFYGGAMFEWRWVRDDVAHLGHRLEVFHIHPSTVIDYDDDDPEHPGRLVSLRQQTQRGSADIEGHRLLAFPYGAFDGEFEGWTRWRAIGMWVEAKWQSLVSYGVYLRRSGGILAVRETEEGRHSSQARVDIDEFLDQAEEGTAMAGYLPFGTDAQFLSFSSSGAAASPVDFWRYVDQMIDHLNHQHADSLGATAATGSRALGETFVVKEANKWAAFVNELLGDISDVLFPLIAADLGYEDCRLPVLSLAEETISVSPAERRERVESGITSGIYPKTPALVRWLAKEDGLDEDVIAELEAAAAAAGAAGAGPAAGTGVMGTSAGPTLIPPLLASEPDDDGLVEVVDASGHAYRTHQALTELEGFVAWDDMDRSRERLDDDVERRLSVIIDQHRQDLVVAIDGGTDEGLTEAEIDAAVELVRFEFVQRYRRVIEEYVVAVEQMQEGQATDEMQRQVDSGETERPVDGEQPTPTMLERMVEELGDMALGQVEALQRAIGRAADTLARRVEGDIVDGWGSTLLATRARDVRPVPTYRQLVAPVRRLGNRAENAGRTIVAALGAQAAGLYVIETQRSSVRDRNRCGTCKSRHNKVWSLRTPEEVRAFVKDPEAQTPDPECDGREACRCGHVLRYRVAPTGPTRTARVRRSGDVPGFEAAEGAAPALAARSIGGLIEGWRSIRRGNLPSIGQLPKPSGQ